MRNLSLLQLAAVGFLIGVFLHACIVFAVLDDGESTANSPRRTPEVPVASPTASVLPDRTSCEEISGTDYRSESERQWFIANCT